jgi:hypothetical protein
MGNTRQAKRQILISVALWLLLVPFSVRAEDSMELNSAIRILGNAIQVEGGRIGYAGSWESAVFKAYRLIASSQNAKSIFEKLLKNLPPKARAARIYALMWAFENDKTLYDEYKYFFAQKKIIKISSEDVIITCTLREVEGSIENGRLKSVLYASFPHPRVPSYVYADCGMKLDDAIEILGNAFEVESRRVGDGGMESVVFKAYLLIASSQNAKNIFAKILKKSSPKATAAKVYALMWAFDNDKTLYDKYKKFLEQDAYVHIYNADIAFSYTLCEARNHIEDGILQSSVYMDEVHLPKTPKPSRPTRECITAIDKARQMGVPIPAAAK